MSNEQTHALTLIRLISGEEIIAKVQELEGAYELISPIAIGYIESHEGKISVRFMPFMSQAKDATVMLMASSVQAVANPTETLVNNYLVALGEKPNIIKPSSDIVLP